MSSESSDCKLLTDILPLLQLAVFGDVIPVTGMCLQRALSRWTADTAHVPEHMLQKEVMQ